MTDNSNRWKDTSFPESLKGRKALILSGAFAYDVSIMFEEAGFEIVEGVEEADDIVFIGGVDVNPSLYGEDRIPQTQHPNDRRDAFEKRVYEQGVKLGKNLFGICRGAQFLHAMNGGTLWQHVEGHAGYDHDIVDYEGNIVSATSIHHQMLRENDRIHVIASSVTTLSQEDGYLAANEGFYGPGMNEIEAGAYYNTKCFFVQGHPEVGSDEYRSWTFHRYAEFLKQVSTQNDQQTLEGVA